jgi:hypothetical protein
VLVELVELRRCLKEAEVECVTEAGQLAILMGGISKVLVDHGMPPIPGIPQDLRMAGNILQVAGTILERLREAYAFSHII